MRARDLAQHFPSVGLDDDALAAARAMAESGRPGIVVLDEEGRPATVLPGSQVLRFIIPRYVQEDPHLSRVYDEKAADDMVGQLADASVRDLLPEASDHAELPVVDGDATWVELAAVMARMRSPLAVVVEQGEVLGVVTVSHLLRCLPDRTAGTAT
jgi:CBS domain-containing protein